VAGFEGGLSLVTLHCSCEYLTELRAFDIATVREGVGSVARGERQIACIRRAGDDTGNRLRFGRDERT